MSYSHEITFKKRLLICVFLGNVRGPKVVIALRSSVFFWPRSFPPTSSKLLGGGIIWKEIICPVYWYIKYISCIKGIRVAGVEMGVPNCMQNWESVESWRWDWYRSGETKLLNCTFVTHKRLHFYMYRRYRISNNCIPMTDKTIPKRNNRLKSEMTTLGPTCRLLGFIFFRFFSLFTHFVCVNTTTLNRFMHQPFVYPAPKGPCVPGT